MTLEALTKQPKSRTHPTLRQLRFQRKYRRSEVEEEIKDLEREFQFTKKSNDPGQWFYLQDQLGEAYRKLMNIVKAKNNG